MKRVWGLFTAIACFCVLVVEPAGQESTLRPETPDGLVATRHQPLPTALADYWLVPDAIDFAEARADPTIARIAGGISLVTSGDDGEGLALLAEVPAEAALSTYAQYYSAVALMDRNQLDAAETALATLAQQRPEGALARAVVLRLADVALSRGTSRQVVDVLVALAETIPNAAPDVWLKRGLVEEAAGRTEQAVDAFERVYYRSPTSEAAAPAKVALGRLDALALDTPGAVVAELGRAELLYSARQWADARTAFSAVLPETTGQGKELVALRLAESDHSLRRYRAARDGVRPLIGQSAYEAEARYVDASSARALGERAGYVRLVRELVKDHPTSEWAAEALNGLATHYITTGEDAEADDVLRELLEGFPKHRHSERAAWKVGWLAYRQRRYAETVTFFERAAAAFPRADNRPGWLYWAGRARDQMGDSSTAIARYRLVASDYQNSYYGRLASGILTARRDAPMPLSVTTSVATPESRLPNEAVIRLLLAAGLVDDALQEIEYAQQAWGDSPRLQATVAWVRNRQAAALSSTERFAALRGAITLMRRAYPQFMAAGGEALPSEVLRIIFPLDYWPLIKKYASERALDPFLVAALVAQESTFTAEIRSAANAHGLMQIIPGTGRDMARKMGMKGFTVATLRQPEPNVRIGTQYFKDLLDRFGGAHFALAGYNAGPHRVVQWKRVAPDVPADEFVDSIPFAETQGYVKRILGTADDYRRLYDGGALDPYAGLAPAPVSAAPVAAPKAVVTTPRAAASSSPRPRRAPARR